MNPKNAPSIYRERVLPSVGSFTPLLLIAPTFWLTFALINQVLGLVVGCALTIAIATAMVVNSPVIELSEDYLRVGKARISLKYLGAAEFISKQAAFSERGPKLNVRAFFRYQMGVGTLVKVVVEDKNDPTPYWLFSSHQAEFLAALLNKRAK